MIRMGFSNNWVRRIFDCVSSVSFAFKLNRNVFGHVKPSRGLRQGDPISPYLFILWAEAFSSLVSRAMQSQDINGVQASRGAPYISHLFFADDSIFLLGLYCMNSWL